ncbi:MAG: hypothetical protein BGO67_10270 [Alphaproteobacteria bacterium 41-28]|nr:MAG: hypothetical protein BGO67_10270 [Alphaproteobacteria bacterium 41-28]
MHNNSFIQLKKVQNSHMRLICFHHAGGSASTFNSWKNAVDPRVEVYSAQLPGRETRLSEPLCNTMEEVQDSLINDFLKLGNLPCIFFGHSLGGIIAYELAKKLYLLKGILPKHLLIASIRAPHMPLRAPEAHKLNDTNFIREIRKYEALPREIINDKEFKSYFLPIIRSDFRISESYINKETFVLDCNITTMVGDHDHSCSLIDLMAWEKYTSKNYNHFVLFGDHFFVKSNFSNLIKIINQTIDYEVLEET